MIDRPSTIESYAQGPQRLEAAIAGLSAEELDIHESEGRWTIRQIVHHVADGDDLWKAFIKQAIGDPGGRFNLAWYWALRQEEWAERWAYSQRDIEPSLALFRANRGHVVQLLHRLPETWTYSLVIRWPDGEEDDTSVAWVVEMQAQHVIGHVDDIRRARQAHGL